MKLQVASERVSTSVAPHAASTRDQRKLKVVVVVLVLVLVLVALIGCDCVGDLWLTIWLPVHNGVVVVKTMAMMMCGR
jgi:hypothetical protein